MNVADMNFNVANMNFNIANMNFNVANADYDVANMNLNCECELEFWRRFDAIKTYIKINRKVSGTSL